MYLATSMRHLGGHPVKGDSIGAVGHHLSDRLGVVADIGVGSDGGKHLAA